MVSPTGSPTARGHQDKVNGTCDPAYPVCKYPEDLYINNQYIGRVANLSEVTASTSYFDYLAAEILSSRTDGRHLWKSVICRARSRVRLQA